MVTLTSSPASTSVCTSDAVCGSASSLRSPSTTGPTAPSAASASASTALKKPLHLHILQLPPPLLLKPNLNLNNKDPLASALMLRHILCI